MSWSVGSEVSGRGFIDAAVITSFPGLADLTDARVLAELGDDRTRFADARALKAYTGVAPVIRVSGKSLVVHHRKVKTSAWLPPATSGPSPPCEHLVLGAL
ncbi:hypothetical protein GCM10022226_32940 [Sphaerisporangium flaviroseum]|uniref:Transposase IS116/IS110/IS902 C-terminal domain-containing protein n=1 Tax=Sphaerisporangium flaviroseum TaxID=509199 RepID=A0ABP7I5M9_9ACTN